MPTMSISQKNKLRRTSSCFRFAVVLSLLFFSTLIQAQSGFANRPNIIFILTDDHNYTDLGITGNPVVKTPHIDQLAKDGVLFTNAYVSSAICTPSRACYFLSQYERTHGVNFNSGTSVSPEAWQESYPVLLRNAGYYTGYIGKNHVPIGEGGYNSGLIEKSFDYWYGGHGHLGFYPKKVHDVFKGANNNTQVEVVQEGVMDFLDDNSYKLKNALHFLESRPKDQPFCLSVCFNLPHGAGTSSMKMLPEDSVIYRDLYRDKQIDMPKHYVAKKDIKKQKLPHTVFHPEDRQNGYDYVDNPEDNKERIIREYQAITGIDGMVGNLRKKLKQLNLDENTIIVFSSDHGLFKGQFGLGGKGLCYQVTTHVPLIIYNPLMKKASGKTTDALVQSIDVAPTLLHVAGVAISKTYQGKSLVPILENKSAAIRDYVFAENLWSTHFGNPRCESVQDKEWKYVRYYANNNISAAAKIDVAKEMDIPQNKVLYGVHDVDMIQYRIFAGAPLKGELPVYEELYHLKTDPAEAVNLATQSRYKTVLDKMRAVWKQEITKARGEGKPKIVRFTVDGEAENNRVYQSK